VVNDVGPFIPKAALERIAAYLSKPRRFTGLAEAEAHLREVYAPFGFRSDAAWRRFAEDSVTQAPGGEGFVPAYDPAIAEAFRSGPLEDVALWEVWERIAVPVLALRGADSDLLLAQTAQEMQRRGQGCALVELPGHGHAPPLVGDYEIRPIMAFLNEA
jgi:pimeloyl-ACP methyl ester carboxylesterase